MNEPEPVPEPGFACSWVSYILFLYFRERARARARARFCLFLGFVYFIPLILIGIVAPNFARIKPGSGTGSGSFTKTAALVVRNCKENMPTYEYRCKECGHKQEALQKMSDAPLRTCAKCGKDTLQRGPGGGSGFVLQGGGWYSSDYSPNRPVGDLSSEKDSSGGCCPCGKGSGGCSTPPKTET